MLQKEIRRYVDSLNEQTCREVLCSIIDAWGHNQVISYESKLNFIVENAEEYNKLFPEGW